MSRTLKRGRDLIALFGSAAEALKATHPDTSGYDSRDDFEAVQAARDTPPPLMIHPSVSRSSGPAQAAPNHPAMGVRQEDVPAGVWQSSCTATGIATPLSSQPGGAS